MRLKTNDFMLPVEACRLLGIHRDTLRQWTSRGLICAARVTPLGWRLYLRRDVESLRNKMKEQRKIGTSLLRQNRCAEICDGIATHHRAR